jgi:hypothetical protein
MTVLPRVSSRLLTFILFVLCLFGTSAWAQDPTNPYNVGFPENGVFSGLILCNSTMATSTSNFPCSR